MASIFTSVIQRYNLYGLIALDLALRFSATVYLQSSDRVSQAVYLYALNASAIVIASYLSILIIPISVRYGENKRNKYSALRIESFILLLAHSSVISIILVSVFALYNLEFPSFVIEVVTAVAFANIGLIAAYQKINNSIKDMLLVRVISTVLYALLVVGIICFDLEKASIYLILNLSLVIPTIYYVMKYKMFLYPNVIIKSAYYYVSTLNFQVARYKNFIVMTVFFTFHINMDRLLVVANYPEIYSIQYAQATTVFSIIIVIYSQEIAKIYSQLVNRKKGSQVIDQIVKGSMLVGAISILAVLLFYFYVTLYLGDTFISRLDQMVIILYHYNAYVIANFVFTFFEPYGKLFYIKLLVLVGITALYQYFLREYSIFAIPIMDTVLLLTCLYVVKVNKDKREKIFCN